MYNITFEQPSTILISGATNTGKTTICNKIIKHKHVLFENPPKYVVYCYSHKQDEQHQMYQKGLISKLLEDFPGYEEIKAILMPYKNIGSLLVLDDGLSNLNDDIARIFFELSHHVNCTVILTAQNLFYSNRHFRTLSLNTKVK